MVVVVVVVVAATMPDIGDGTARKRNGKGRRGQ